VGDVDACATPGRQLRAYYLWRERGRHPLPSGICGRSALPHVLLDGEIHEPERPVTAMASGSHEMKAGISFFICSTLNSRKRCQVSVTIQDA